MNNVTVNPWHVDSFLLRFCRARKFDLDKIILMFSNYMEYRKTNELDDILAVSIHSLSYNTLFFYIDFPLRQKRRMHATLSKRIYGC